MAIDKNVNTDTAVHVKPATQCITLLTQADFALPVNSEILYATNEGCVMKPVMKSDEESETQEEHLTASVAS